MKKTVMLSIRGRQSYMDQDPEIIELVTEGTLERCEDGWIICYQESNLTGLEGVTTSFRVAPRKNYPHPHRQAQFRDGIPGGYRPRIPL